MFDSLKERFEQVFTSLRGKGKLTVEDINEALREVRRALLEADVNFKVVKDFVEAIRERATGADVLSSITPGQQVVTIVYEELLAIMGKDPVPLIISPKPPTVYMMVGLQGSGKTTTTVKIAKRLSKSHKPLVVACDLRRPAAVDQLRILAQKSQIAFYGPNDGETDPVAVAKRSIAYASEHLCDLILLDTAGRLQMDAELMAELENMKAAVPPHEILLVVDSMTGQEAVQVAMVFHEKLTPRKLLCVLAALCGMVFVSGVPQSGLPEAGEATGILLALLSAVLYASDVSINKFLDQVPACERTLVQLAVAALVMIPYILLTEDVAAMALTPLGAVLLLIVGVFHTGWCYSLFFGSMTYLPAQTVVLFSYIDPIVAIFLSALLLKEPLGWSGILGAVLVLGSTLISELPVRAAAETK